MRLLKLAIPAVVVGLVPVVADGPPSPQELAKLPLASPVTADFRRDIQPILEASCVKCHGRGREKGGFKLDSRETLLKPADSGPAVIEGDSAHSRLIHLVAGLDPDSMMPKKGSKLTPKQIGLLRAWIDQGLKWDPQVTFARPPAENLTPRRPAMPDSLPGGTHPVDRILGPYFASGDYRPEEVVDDRTFARRVFLDSCGLLPTPEELEAFLKDSSPDKRTRQVQRLLADDQRYAQHWLTFWNDLLRNDYRGAGYIDNGREQISQWLYASLRDNLPYDQFVRELVNPSAKGPKGFTKGIVWRGAVNASQTPPLQAAQNISQVFLGVNLKCASCHDSFIDDWQLSDSYGLAGVYADGELEMVQCDKPLGKHAPVKFLFPELGAFEDKAPKDRRIARLAEILASPKNGRLPRTIVNRLWARFMGRGLVEPLDVMQNAAWCPDLLDWLAEDFVEHGYNLRHTMEVILTSRAYQLPSVNLPDKAEPGFVFRGPGVRRLTAEQFRDAVGQLTGTWNDKPEGGLDSLMISRAQAKPLPVSAFWIWSDPHASEAVPPETVYLRRHLNLPEPATEAVIFVNADNTHRLYINGKEARKQNSIEWNETSVLDARPFLRKGDNVFAVEAKNSGEAPNPAGLLFYAKLRHKNAGVGQTGSSESVFDMASDASWRVSTNKIEGWTSAEFDDHAWSPAQVLGGEDAAPWNLGIQFSSAVAARPIYGQVRASLVAADPLAVALGRPNREQVNTTRPYTATTLQALELTNGKTLAELLKTGSEKIATSSANGTAVVDRVFAQALGRKPTEAEARLAGGLVGDKPKPDGVEDLLWSVAMLPEFQLIY